VCALIHDISHDFIAGQGWCLDLSTNDVGRVVRQQHHIFEIAFIEPKAAERTIGALDLHLTQGARPCTEICGAVQRREVRSEKTHPKIEALRYDIRCRVLTGVVALSGSCLGYASNFGWLERAGSSTP
jgi:hypothetical protein